MSQLSRSALIDCTKALACAAIVWHHLAFYGPMSEAAHTLMPAVMDWLFEYGRMAVQVFLVLGGYLAAASLAPEAVARFAQAGPQVGRRFVRLVVPYAVALVIAIVVSALVRPWYDHPSVSEDPDLWQLLAHALLLQGIVGEESLSAGVWYVSIDFQLFALTVMSLAGLRALAVALSNVRANAAHWAHPLLRRWPWPISEGQAVRSAVVLAVVLSLYGVNRDPDWDDWAAYFFGSYGLGMLAFWAARSRSQARAWGLSLLMLALAAGALWLEWRPRIALAAVTALVLVAAMRQSVLLAWQGGGALRRLGQMSYSVFLVHFPVCLLVNAVYSLYWPGQVWPAIVGMVLAFGLSLLAGWGLYERVERHVGSWHAALRWQASLVGAGLLTTLVAGMR